MSDTIHSCSSFCKLPACVEQRHRQDFEAWFFDEYTLESNERINNAEYRNDAVQSAWLIWQAATKRATALERERCAKLCELIKKTALATQAGPTDDLSNVMVRQVAHLGAGVCADLIRQGADTHGKAHGDGDAAKVFPT